MCSILPLIAREDIKFVIPPPPKKFRRRGNKDDAVSAFYQLQDAELGRLIEISGSSGAATVSTI